MDSETKETRRELRAAADDGAVATHQPGRESDGLAAEQMSRQSFLSHLCDSR